MFLLNMFFKKKVYSGFLFIGLFKFLLYIANEDA